MDVMIADLANSSFGGPTDSLHAEQGRNLRKPLRSNTLGICEIALLDF